MNERIRFKARKPLAPKNRNEEEVKEVKPPKQEMSTRPGKLRKKRDSVPIYTVEQRSQNSRREMVWYYNTESLSKESFRQYDDRALSQNPVNKVRIDKKLRNHHTDNDAPTT